MLNGELRSMAFLLSWQLFTESGQLVPIQRKSATGEEDWWKQVGMLAGSHAHVMHAQICKANEMHGKMKSFRFGAWC